MKRSFFARVKAIIVTPSIVNTSFTLVGELNPVYSPFIEKNGNEPSFLRAINYINGRSKILQNGRKQSAALHRKSDCKCTL